MSRPIKLRRGAPPAICDDKINNKRQKTTVTTQTDIIPGAKPNRSNRFFIGDGRLQSVMDQVLPLCSELIDLISLFEIDCLYLPRWVFQNVIPPLHGCIVKTGHAEQFKKFVEHIISKIGWSNKELTEETLRGSIFISMQYENDTKLLSVVAAMPLSRQVMLQFLLGSQRTRFKKYFQPTSETSSSVEPVMWVDYEDQGPLTTTMDLKGFPSDFGKDPSAPNPFASACPLCTLKK